MNTKKQNYVKAYNNLIEAEQYEFSNDLYIDGYIKRYELCFELAWKALKEYLIYEGYKEDSFIGPKSILNVAFESNIIDNEEIWSDMLKTRNSTTHLYSKTISRKLCKDIQNKYVQELRKLKEFFDNKDF